MAQVLPPSSNEKRTLVLAQDALGRLPRISLHHYGEEFGSRMRTPVLVPGVFLLSATIFWQPIEAPDCCPIKTVTDALEEELNGVYTLKTKKDSKPDPKCIDDCVYMRGSEEYCFIEKPGATVVCEVSTLSSTTLVTHFFFHFVILRRSVFC